MAKPGIGHNSIRTVTTAYPNYSFIDKDPAIHSIATVLRDAGVLKGNSLKFSVAEDSGVSHGCIRNWIFGKTRQPSHSRLAAVAGAIGYDFVLAPRQRNRAEASAPKIMKRFPTTEMRSPRQTSLSMPATMKQDVKRSSPVRG